jgi:hypothetical protein
MRALHHAALSLMLTTAVLAQPTDLAAQATGTMPPKPGAMEMMHDQMAGAMVMGHGDHAATGHLTLATVNGRQVLRLDRSFKVDKGPDVWVLLSRDGSPTSMGATTIVKLTRHEGAQDILLPTGLDLAPFTHVVFYCKKYSAIMGVAELAAARPKMADKKGMQGR